MWSESPGFLSEPYGAYSNREEIYVDPIAIRQGQQDVHSDTNGAAFIRMDVCVVGAGVDCDTGPEGDEWITPGWAVEQQLC